MEEEKSVGSEEDALRHVTLSKLELVMVMSGMFVDSLVRVKKDLDRTRELHIQ